MRPVTHWSARSVSALEVQRRVETREGRNSSTAVPDICWGSLHGLPQLRKPSLVWLLSVATCRQPGTGAGVQARLHVQTARSRWPASSLGCLALGVRLFLGRLFRLGRLSGRGAVSRFIGGLVRRRSVDRRQLRPASSRSRSKTSEWHLLSHARPSRHGVQ